LLSVRFSQPKFFFFKPLNNSNKVFRAEKKLLK
jgi:hypothetical protein